MVNGDRLLSDLTAYHEAGHAFMAVYVGADVRAVSIEPDRDDGPQRYGHTEIGLSHERFSDREIVEKSVLIALAGPVAEAIYRGEPLHPAFVAEWSQDWRTVWMLAEELIADEQKRMTYLESAVLELRIVLEQELHWAAVAAIADELLAHEMLEPGDVDEIVRPWMFT